ncbi:epithelial-stromal interaction protein 1 [Scleropages formosus]|uniref:Epithelial stromal interaction 1 n=1 Tax=Scleropages formosus TaxID=113540 RepID=A0A8C9RBF9_SCLFO|nr:epithelial-stromal interaction protein 1 [Scleropages formosus]
MDPGRRTNPSYLKYPAHDSRGAESQEATEEQADGSESASASAPAHERSETNHQQPNYAGGYTVIPPNESRRTKLQRMVQKEEEDLQRWRETHRAGPINLSPARLGGAVSLAEARQKQFVDLRQSKLRKKLKQEDMERKMREAAEEEVRKMKAIQREKAIKLEEKKKLEEQKRREQYRQDHQVKTQQFLQRFERSFPMAASSSLPTSSWGRAREHREAQRAEEEGFLMQMKEEQRRKSEILEEKQKQLEEQRERDVDAERRRVNATFLDRLQGKNESSKEVQPPHLPLEELDVRDLQSCEFQIPTTSSRPHLHQVPVTLPQLDPPQVQRDKAKGEETDHEWAVMKLLIRFPSCEREFLQDIVAQCNGDYQQACSLLE